MALNRDYFDSIQIDLVKRKYYNANKVHAVFEEIRAQAEELENENRELRERLAALERRQAEQEPELREIQARYREVLERAHERADATVRQAEEKSERLVANAERVSEDAGRMLRDCLLKLQAREQENLEHLSELLRRVERPGTASAISPRESTDSVARGRLEKPVPAVDEAAASAAAEASPAGAVGPMQEEEELFADIESRISELARQINELESI